MIYVSIGAKNGDVVYAHLIPNSTHVEILGEHGIGEYRWCDENGAVFNPRIEGLEGKPLYGRKVNGNGLGARVTKLADEVACITKVLSNGHQEAVFAHPIEPMQ